MSAYDDEGEMRLKLSSFPQNYYVEVPLLRRDKKANTYATEYRYVLLKMCTNRKIDLSEEEIKFNESVIREFTRKNNIPTYDDITAEQDKVLNELLQRIYTLRNMERNTGAGELFSLSKYMKERHISWTDFTDDETYEAATEAMGASVESYAEKKQNMFDSYLESRGKNYDTLTEEDVQNIGRLHLQQEGGDVASPSGMATLQDYMKRHGIRSYEDLTEEDQRNFEEELIGKHSQSSGKNTTKKKKSR